MKFLTQLVIQSLMIFGQVVWAKTSLRNPEENIFNTSISEEYNEIVSLQNLLEIKLVLEKLMRYEEQDLNIKQFDPILSSSFEQIAKLNFISDTLGQILTEQKGFLISDESRLSFKEVLMPYFLNDNSSTITKTQLVLRSLSPYFRDVYQEGVNPKSIARYYVKAKYDELKVELLLSEHENLQKLNDLSQLPDNFKRLLELINNERTWALKKPVLKYLLKIRDDKVLEKATQEYLQDFKEWYEISRLNKKNILTCLNTIDIRGLINTLADKISEKIIPSFSEFSKPTRNTAILNTKNENYSIRLKLEKSDKLKLINNESVVADVQVTLAYKPNLDEISIPDLDKNEFSSQLSSSARQELLDNLNESTVEIPLGLSITGVELKKVNENHNGIIHINGTDHKLKISLQDIGLRKRLNYINDEFNSFLSVLGFSENSGINLTKFSVTKDLIFNAHFIWNPPGILGEMLNNNLKQREFYFTINNDGFNLKGRQELRRQIESFMLDAILQKLSSNAISLSIPNAIEISIYQSLEKKRNFENREVIIGTIMALPKENSPFKKVVDSIDPINFQIGFQNGKIKTEFSKANIYLNQSIFQIFDSIISEIEIMKSKSTVVREHIIIKKTHFDLTAKKMNISISVLEEEVDFSIPISSITPSNLASILRSKFQPVLEQKAKEILKRVVADLYNERIDFFGLTFEIYDGENKLCSTELGEKVCLTVDINKGKIKILDFTELKNYVIGKLQSSGALNNDFFRIENPSFQKQNGIEVLAVDVIVENFLSLDEEIRSTIYIQNINEIKLNTASFPSQLIDRINQKFKGKFIVGNEENSFFYLVFSSIELANEPKIYFNGGLNFTEIFELEFKGNSTTKKFEISEISNSSLIKTLADKEFKVNIIPGFNVNASIDLPKSIKSINLKNPEASVVYGVLEIDIPDFIPIPDINFAISKDKIDFDPNLQYTYPGVIPIPPVAIVYPTIKINLKENKLEMEALLTLGASEEAQETVNIAHIDANVNVNFSKNSLKDASYNGDLVFLNSLNVMKGEGYISFKQPSFYMDSRSSGVLREILKLNQRIEFTTEKEINGKSSIDILGLKASLNLNAQLLNDAIEFRFSGKCKIPLTEVSLGLNTKLDASSPSSIIDNTSAFLNGKAEVEGVEIARLEIELDKDGGYLTFEALGVPFGKPIPSTSIVTEDLIWDMIKEILDFDPKDIEEFLKNPKIRLKPQFKLNIKTGKGPKSNGKKDGKKSGEKGIANWHDNKDNLNSSGFKVPPGSKTIPNSFKKSKFSNSYGGIFDGTGGFLNYEDLNIAQRSYAKSHLRSGNSGTFQKGSYYVPYQGAIPKWAVPAPFNSKLQAKEEFIKIVNRPLQVFIYQRDGKVYASLKKNNSSNESSMDYFLGTIEDLKQLDMEVMLAESVSLSLIFNENQVRLVPLFTKFPFELYNNPLTKKELILNKNTPLSTIEGQNLSSKKIKNLFIEFGDRKFFRYENYEKRFDYIVGDKKTLLELKKIWEKDEKPTKDIEHNLGLLSGINLLEGARDKTFLLVFFKSGTARSKVKQIIEIEKPWKVQAEFHYQPIPGRKNFKAHIEKISREILSVTAPIEELIAFGLNNGKKTIYELMMSEDNHSDIIFEYLITKLERGQPNIKTFKKGVYEIGLWRYPSKNKIKESLYSVKNIPQNYFYSVGELPGFLVDYFSDQMNLSEIPDLTQQNDITDKFFNGILFSQTRNKYEFLLGIYKNSYVSVDPQGKIKSYDYNKSDFELNPQPKTFIGPNLKETKFNPNAQTSFNESEWFLKQTMELLPSEILLFDKFNENSRLKAIKFNDFETGELSWEIDSNNRNVLNLKLSVIKKKLNNVKGRLIDKEHKIYTLLSDEDNEEFIQELTKLIFSGFERPEIWNNRDMIKSNPLFLLN